MNLRRGSLILGLVVLILCVVGILGMSLSRTVNEKTLVVYTHTISGLLDLAAVEMSEVVFRELELRLNNHEDSLHKSLVSAKPDDFPIRIPASGLPATFCFSGQKEYSTFSHSLSVELCDPEPLVASGSWVDQQEKNFKIKLVATLSLGQNRWRRMTKRFCLVRAGRCLSLSLPYVSKFTLFVKKPEVTDATHAGFNCIRNTINGETLPRLLDGAEYPLILKNNPRTKDPDLVRPGFVFLGGSRETELHLAAGAHPQWGEYFQFFNMEQPETKPPVVNVSPHPDTEAFESGLGFRNDLGEAVQLKPMVKGVFGGFYVQDEKNPPGDMDSRGALGAHFSADEPRTKQSSFLHLYGNISHPSPTVVIGKVKRVYPFFARMLLDFNGCIIKFGPWLSAPVLHSGDFWETLANPQGFSFENGFFELDPPVTVREIFGEASVYESMASRLVIEDYNYSYDWLIDTTGQIPPPLAFAKAGGGLYSQDGSKLPFTIFGKSEPMVINLNDATSENLLQGRISYVAEDQADFDARFRQDPSRINLGGHVVYIKKGPLVLERGTTVVSSGILAVHGDVLIKGGVSSTKSETMFSVLAHQGDIIIDGENEEVEAFLIALEGKVRGPSQSAIKVRGGIAVHSLPPADIPYGGEVAYDQRFDPTTSAHEAGFAIQIADYFESWEAGVQ